MLAVRGRAVDTATQTSVPAPLPVSTPPVYTREELLAETNTHRQTPLTLDPVLNQTAQEKCEAMAAKNEFEHGNLKPIADKLNRRIGENLTYGMAATAGVVVMNWMNSPSPRDNLTDKVWTRVGFGMCPFRGGTLVVQHFSDSPRINRVQKYNDTDLNPYKYAVPPDAGYTGFQTPKVEVSPPPTYKPYNPQTPNVSITPKDDCHVALVYC